MTVSTRRLEANRANAKKSTGPKTAEGKAKCSKNAITHGLCASTLVLETEDAEKYNHLRDNYVTRFAPRDLVEMDLVERMVHATWVTQRTWTLETDTIDLQIFRMRGSLDREFAEIPPHMRTAFAIEELAKKPVLSLLQRYEARQTNEYQRALKTLQELRKTVPLAAPGPLAPDCQTDPSPIPDTQEPLDPTPATATKPHRAETPADRGRARIINAPTEPRLSGTGSPTPLDPQPSM